MYEDLPDSVKESVHFCLKTDNFPEAKRIHDSWVASCMAKGALRPVLGDVLPAGEEDAHLAC